MFSRRRKSQVQPISSPATSPSSTDGKSSLRRRYKQLLSKKIREYWASCSNYNTMVDDNGLTNGFLHGMAMYRFRITSDGQSYTIKTWAIEGDETNHIFDEKELSATVRPFLADACKTDFQRVDLSYTADGTLMMEARISVEKLTQDGDEFDDAVEKFLDVRTNVRETLLR